MNTKVLVVNAGSSSLKFSLYEMPGARELINGNVEKIGLKDSFCSLKIDGKKLSMTFMLKIMELLLKLC